MIQRIIKLREEEGLSQEKFAEKIGLSRNFINQVENGKKNFSDRTISDICEKFNIDENWLRTGEGNKEAPINPDDRFASNLGKLQRTDNDTIIRWVNMIAETNPEVLKQVEEFMKKLESYPWKQAEE